MQSKKISRRAALSTSAALAVPATIAAARGASSPPEPAGKLRPTGIIRLKFEFSVAPDGMPFTSDMRTAHVWIGPASVYHGRSDDMIAHGWEAQYIDDGERVVAVKMTPRRFHEDGEYRDGEEPNRYQLAALKHVRRTILHALEADDEVSRISMDTGGDGRADFSLYVGRASDVASIHMRLAGEDE